MTASPADADATSRVRPQGRRPIGAAAADAPEIEILAPSLPALALEAFRSDVTLASAVVGNLARDHGIPPGSVRVVLADDFVEAVERWLPATYRRQEGGSFRTAREGGEVVAKNLDQSDDGSDIVIVFSAAHWARAEDPIVRARLATIVAHELSHPPIERLRYVCGAMDGVSLPSITGTESARSMTRIHAGEYRADRLSELIVGAYITETVDGEQHPFRLWRGFGADGVESIRDVLERAVPRWPDVVDEYRNWRLDLASMYQQVGNMVDQTITAIVHVQASADAAETGIDVLELPEIAGLAATRLYLADTVAPFIEVMRTIPILPRLEEARDVEERIVRAGETMILEIWRRLGLTVVERADRHWGLEVDEPFR